MAIIYTGQNSLSGKHTRQVLQRVDVLWAFVMGEGDPANLVGIERE